MRGKRLVVTCGVAVLAAVASYPGCDGGVVNPNGGSGLLDGAAPGDGGPSGTFDNGTSVLCADGQDLDGDGFGNGCQAGADCDDKDWSRHAGAPELCDGKDNDCDGKADEDLTGCNASNVGSGTPFPLDPAKDKNLKGANGVNLDDNGDLVLGANVDNYGYMWIANTDDLDRGTLSKIDTKALKEVARYFTVTCKSKPGATGCVDANGRAIKANQANTPSRTAVDFNMDVWVANRCLDGCQPSATKVANNVADCIDRNNNGRIDTSADVDKNGRINPDCDKNGQPDTFATKCANGKAPEFLGEDDECILFTVAYGDPGDIARSICLNAGKATIGASNAWVGTYKRPENGRGNNLFFKLAGATGKIEQTLTMPKEHHTYGCMADGHNLIWSTDIGHYEHELDGSLTYFQTTEPYSVGQVLRGPTKDQPWNKGYYRHYGIAVDALQNIWVGGIDDHWVLRYRPNRASFDTLHKGTWTRVNLSKDFTTRGVATDNRGKVWVAIQQGAILRLEQSLPDGIHDRTNIKEGVDYWTLTAQEVIGTGIDIDLHVWGVGKSNSTASRLDVDASGNVIKPVQGKIKNVKVGLHPYTYSDFTGFGLRTFVRPQGQWTYLHKPCPEGQKAIWNGVSWNATTPAGTGVSLRVRSGDTEATLGPWSASFAKSPAEFGSGSAAPLTPNPAALLQVEFTLTNQNKTNTPTLHDYAILYSCVGQLG